jgi:hypothetical protein
MSELASIERLRHGALAMLADGNSAEAVAHVLEVPVEAVRAWAALPPAAAPAGDVAVRPVASPHRFDTELFLAPSKAMRGTSAVLAVVLAAGGFAFSYTSFRDAHGRVQFLVDGVMFLVVTGVVVRMMLSFARRTLVLGRTAITAPRALIAEHMAYEDVAGYTLADHTLDLGRGPGMAGQLLAIQSRRPGVAPLTVFLPEYYPIDLRVLSRLDTVARANAAVPLTTPARHPAPRHSGIPGTTSFAVIALMCALGIIGLLPNVHDSVAALTASAPAAPPPPALRHVEGTIVSAQDCTKAGPADAKPSRQRVGITTPTGSSQADIPCLFAPASLIAGGPHRLGLDIEAQGDSPHKVYRVALDGRLVLDALRVPAPPPRQSRAASWALLAVALLPIAALVAAIVLAWMRATGASSRPERGAAAAVERSRA